MIVMEDKTDESKPSTYGADITVIMPGKATPSTFHIEVEAEEPIEATARALDEWNSRTDPSSCEVRVKKINSKDPKQVKKE